MVEHFRGVWMRARSQAARRRNLSKTRQLIRDAIISMTRRGDMLTDSELAHLERLARANDGLAAVQPPTGLSWLVIVIAVLLAVIAVLSVTQIRHTETVIDVTASGLRFVAAPEQALVGADSLQEVGFAGVPDPMSAADIARFVRIRAPRGRSLTLAELTSKSRAQVWIHTDLIPDFARFVIQPVKAEPGANWTATITGEALEISVDGDEWRPTQRRRLVIDLRLRADGYLVFHRRQSCFACSEIDIDALQFERDKTGRDVRSELKVSSVHSGSVVLSELTRRVELRKGEALLPAVVDGAVHSIRLREDGLLAIEAGAIVSGIAIGTAYSPKDIMPTQLEWLLSHRTATTAGTLASSSIVALFTALQLFRRSQRR